MLGFSVRSVLTVQCDGCGLVVVVDDDDEIPFTDLPECWKIIQVKGWVGVFHACSDRCEEVVIRDKGTG